MFRSLTTASLILACATAAADDEPRSAIPWLSDALRVLPEAGEEPPSSDGEITVSTLDAPGMAGIGVIEAESMGLPETLWQNSSALRLRFLTGRLRASGVPAQRALVRRLMMLRAPAPGGMESETGFLRARLDRLLAMGALEEAFQLASAAPHPSPEILLRLFDIALLTGQEHRACKALIDARDVEPTEAARIFCLARDGRWQEAVLTLAVAREDRALSPERSALLALFLESDPDAAEDHDAAVPIPKPMTPLDYAMLTAIGDDGAEAARETHPLAYYHLDLDDRTPPRARILAAEHLVAAGGAPYPILFSAYRGLEPAASGSVWSRAAAVQALDRALASGNPAEIARLLRETDAKLRPIGLRVALAREYAPLLANQSGAALSDPGLFAEILILGGQELLPAEPDPPDPGRLVARALIDPEFDPGQPREESPAAAVLRAFEPEDAPQSPEPELRGLIDADKTGEALLRALRLLDSGTEIDPGDLTAALRVLVALGLEQQARRIAVETLLTSRGAS